MYTKVDNLTQEQTQTLLSLSETVKFYNHDIRPGKNAPEIMSKYSDSKWFNWKRDQKKSFQTVFEDYMSTAVVGWLLHFPAGGFLDEMDYWQNSVSCGSVVCFSLDDDNKIMIDNTPVVLNQSEGLKFNLKFLHSVPKTDTPKNWACLMQL